MLNIIELAKYFNLQQQQDMMALETLCLQTPPGRIRRARVRKIRPNHIPRPVNSFMSYRTEKQFIIRQFCPTANHRDISKMVAKWWHNVSSTEKAIFVNKAKLAKENHNKQYPDYTFRPKAKRLDKKTVTKKKESVVAAQPILDVVDNYSSAARTRMVDNSAPSAVINNNNSFNNNCVTPFNTSAMFNTGSIDTSLMYATGYNSFMQNNVMYSDDVLFKAGESSNVWDTTFQTSDQIMADSYPSLIGTQANYYGTNMYYPEPLAPAISSITTPSAAIDPMTTMLPSSSSSYNVANYTQDCQLYSRLDCQVTPQSQVASTPRLGFQGSPSSPCYDLYDDSLPTAVLTPFATPNNEFLSSWNTNGKFEDTTNLFGDIGFWAGSN
ncbi:hypothetical protein HPULCUR_002873 [Helicostylum pulchrum]|uniref:HMG box domain-containing protein n=1 Tax=Helicostylum pulchrum TaxID=562976 RepID=A0ABP9XRY9_9FUNG